VIIRCVHVRLYDADANGFVDGCVDGGGEYPHFLLAGVGIADNQCRLLDSGSHKKIGYIIQSWRLYLPFQI
jgi:hypothetical protein